jgi:hypothetical protein
MVSMKHEIQTAMRGNKVSIEPMTDSDGEEIVTSYNSGSDKFKAENKWHDHSDFPPAGTECEMYVVTDWHLARIIGMDEEDLCVASVQFDGFRGYHSSAQIADFRPLKTDAELDRDAAIEEMLTFSPYRSFKMTRKAYEALYDAGYRRKHMSREQADERLANHVNDLVLRPFARSQILDALCYGKE